MLPAPAGYRYPSMGSAAVTSSYTPGAGAQGQGGNARVNQARDELYNNARGMQRQVQNDPLDSLIRRQLTDRINGGGPYTDEVRSAYGTQAGHSAAAAEQAQLRNLQARGLSPGDPAYQSAVARLQQERAKTNQDARLRIAMNADLANYNAAGDNLAAGNGFNTSRYGRLSDATQNLQGLLAQENAVGGAPMGGGGMSTGTGYRAPHVATPMRLDPQNTWATGARSYGQPTQQQPQQQPLYQNPWNTYAAPPQQRQPAQPTVTYGPVANQRPRTTSLLPWS